MKIEVLCHNCGQDDTDLTIMEFVGNLYLNPETKSQSQKFECICGIEITVVVYPENG